MKNVRIVVLAVFFALSYVPCVQAQGSTQGETIVSPFMNARIVPSNNIVYCPGFQIAWNMLRDDVIHDSVRLERNPYFATMLNKKILTEEDIPDDCYIAAAGLLSEESVDYINSLLSERGAERISLDYSEIDSRGLFVYSYFDREILLDEEFEKFNTLMHFYASGGMNKATVFGIKEFTRNNRGHVYLAKQIEVLEYKENKDYGDFDCIIRMNTIYDEEILFAKIIPKNTLQGTIADVNMRIQNTKPASIKEGESLQIPFVRVNISNDLDKLLGRNFVNSGWEDKYIARAVQSIRFKLTIKDDSVQREEDMAEQENEYKGYIFNRPFLLYLKKKKSTDPYFAIWVDNSEVFQ